MSDRIFNGNLSDKMPDEKILLSIEWLAEQMPGGFFIYHADDEQEIIYVNKATLQIFGCKNYNEFKELTGNTFRGMVHPEDFLQIQASIDEQIADDTNGENLDYVVYRIIRKDGVERWVDDYGRFTYFPGFGNVYYVFISDITDTRIAQEQQERNKQLERLLEQAEAANRAKTAFLSNMSHEIRTPITAILGMNELIQRECDDPNILEYSANIKKAGTSLLRIISDILDFSKIETGKMELLFEEYSVHSLFSDLYNLIQFRAEDKGLDLIFEIDPRIPSILVGDEIRIKQVISNLLTNAVKYTERGNVKLIVYLQSDEDGQAEIEVTVLDTGIGIRKEEMDKLFEAFDRLDVRRTRTIEGTGLGLAISKQILTLMNSKLIVESEYERGSSFSFVLKQKIADEEPIGEMDFTQIEKHKSEKHAKQGLFKAEGIRVLIVDDTPMNLQVIKGLLKRTGVEIDTAPNGFKCLEKISTEHYDMVFLDYRMPHMNGIETLNEIKQKHPDFYEKVPIISLTASAVAGDREKLLTAGFTDYLAKPVNIDAMERMMIKYLPADSVTLISAEEEEIVEEDDEIASLPKKLRELKELNPEKGIEYCGDAEDYLFALETYVKSIDDKAEIIEKSLSDGDIQAYTFNVHSLKSTSAAIGADAIFEKAKELEGRAKAGENESLKPDTEQLLKDYRELKVLIEDALSE